MANSPYGSAYGSGSSPYSKNRKKKTDKNAELLALAQELGLDKQEVAKPKDNFLQKLGKIVDAPRQSLTNAYSYATGSKRTKGDKSIFDAMGKGFTGQREVNIADILEDSGMGDETLFKMPVTGKEISARDMIGLTGDMVLDPLNLVGIGVAGKAAKLAKLTGEGAQQTVHLNKAGRAAQKSAIQAAKKAGKTEDEARQLFAKELRSNPDKLKGMEDLGGLKIAGQTLVKGKTIAKGAKAVEKVPVAGRVVKGVREGADELGDLFHKGLKAKRAGFEEIVDLAAQSKSAKNAAFDRAQILQKDLEKQIKKAKPKDLSDAEADLRIGNAIEDPNKKESWMESFIGDAKTRHDSLYKVDDSLAKDKGITEEWYRDNYLMRIFKEEPAKVDALLSKYLLKNGLKNKPGFLEKRGFQGTTEDIVKFAEEQGVKLTPASTAERVAARQRMSDIAHGKREALEGIKGYGVLDESLVDQPRVKFGKTENEAQAMTRGATDRDIKNPKFIANAEEQRKQVGGLWQKKREQLEKAIATNRPPEDIARIKKEFEKVNQDYAKLAQAAERNKEAMLPKSVDDIPKPSDRLEDYLPETPIRDYTGAATGRPTPALASLAEEAVKYENFDEFYKAINSGEVSTDLLKAARREMDAEGLIKGGPEDTLADFFAGATGQPKWTNKAKLEQTVDEYLQSFLSKDDVRRHVLGGEASIENVNRLKTIKRRNPEADYMNLMDSFNKGSKIGLDEITEDLVNRGVAADPEDAIRKMLEMPTAKDTTAARIPEMDKLDEIGRMESEASKRMAKEQRRYESEVNKLNLRQQQQLEKMADEGLASKETVQANKKIFDETNPEMKDYQEVPDIPELKGYKFPPTVAKFIHDEFTKTGAPPNNFLKSLDIAMGAWKVGVTSLPTSMVAFHSRNLIGNKFNKWLGGYYNNPLKGGKIDAKVAKEFGSHTDINNVKFTDELGVEWTAEKLRKIGIMGGQAENELNLANKALNVVSKPGRKVGQYVEDPDRVSFFLQQRAMGKSVEEAAAHVNKYLFNYGNQTDLVQKIGKVVPFFTWTANNVPLQVEQLLKQPHKFNKVANLYQSSFNAEEQENLPDYVKEGIFLEGGKKTNDKGDIVQTVIRNLGLPVEDLARLNRGSAGRTFEREVLGSLGPGLKQAAELATGRDFFRGEDLEDVNNQYAFAASNYPDEIKALLGYKETEGGTMADGTKFVNRSIDQENFKAMDMLGLSRLMNTLFPAKGDSSNPIENWEEVGAKAAFPYATSEYNMTDEKKKREKEMLEKITKLLIAEGKLKEYTNYYEPKTDEEKAKDKKKKGAYTTANR